MQIYELSWDWYEEYCPVLFLSPDGEKYSQAQWSKLCDGLVPDAVHYLLKKWANDQYNHIGWNNIVDRIVEVLISRGWKRVTPIKKSMFGGMIIESDDKESLDPSLFESIVAHNKRINGIL